MFNSAKIKELIDKFHGTQIEFCAECGVPKSTIVSVLAKNNPRADTIEALADFCKCPIDYFFDRKVEIDYLSFYQKEKGKAHKKEELPGGYKEMLDQIMDLTRDNLRKDQQIEALKKELEAKKSGGYDIINAAESELKHGK